MRLSVLTLIVSACMVVANPAAGPVAEVDAKSEYASIEKRTVTCKLTGSDIRYHVSPDPKSGAPGQFSGSNNKVPFACWTPGKPVNKNYAWDKIASGKGKGYYISENYVELECSSKLENCNK